jgi:hypothetical protein
MCVCDPGWEGERCGRQSVAASEAVSDSKLPLSIRHVCVVLLKHAGLWCVLTRQVHAMYAGGAGGDGRFRHILGSRSSTEAKVVSHAATDAAHLLSRDSAATAARG